MSQAEEAAKGSVKIIDNMSLIQTSMAPEYE